MFLITLKKIKHAYKSKHNLNCENQVILLMITNGKKWHCWKVYLHCLEE